MSYRPVFALIVLALMGAALLLVLRLVTRWRSARHDAHLAAQQARNAEIWANRNEPRPDR